MSKPNSNRQDRLRVAIVTASLGAAGAEKQAHYIARALSEAGVDVRIYSLMRGGEYAEALRPFNVKPRWFGWLPTPPLRLALLLPDLFNFRPHIIQSVHGYTNFYSAAAARLLNAVSVGGLRSDLASFLKDNGRFASRLLSWPDGIALNSRSAIDQAEREGMPDPKRLYFLPNVIDLARFPERPAAVCSGGAQDCNCIWVGRLFPAKRADVFLRALAAARLVEPSIRGTVIGYGPEEQRVQQLARALGLLPGGLDFLGFRHDVADQLNQSAMLAFTSESEGSPNVILEAMAAQLPVITTPAGDAAELVGSANAGYIVPFGAVETMASAMVRLARSPETRRRLGSAGRAYIAQHYSLSSLAWRLMTMYARIARAAERGRPHALLQTLEHGSELELEASRW